MLERVSQAEEGEEQSPFGPLAEERGPNGRHHHQEVDVEPQRQRGPQAVARGIVATRNIGQDVERDGRRIGQSQQGLADEAQRQEEAGEQAQDQLPILPQPSLGLLLRDGIA